MLPVDAGANTREGTALHSAARRNQPTVARWLIRVAGASLHAVDHKNQTPLHCACAAGAIEVTQWLLCSGASLAARDHLRRTPVGRIVDNGFYDYMNAVKQWPPVLVAAHARLASLFHDLCRSGLYWTMRCDARADLERIVTQPGAFALPPCSATAALAHDFLRAWSPESNYLYPFRFRRLVFTLMIAHRRLALQRPPDQPSPHGLLARVRSLALGPRERAAAAPALPYLPVELWQRILGHVDPARFY
jgi:hypothetical protein